MTKAREPLGVCITPNDENGNVLVDVNPKERRRIRQNILRKSVREQTKALALQAFWGAVKSSAVDHQTRDGLVEWAFVWEEFEVFLAEYKETL